MRTMLKMRAKATGGAALALLLLAVTGCGPAVNAQEGQAPSDANVPSVASNVPIERQVRPAVGSPGGAPPANAAPDVPVPAWVSDAVFYQIFPERFANGDPQNDPTRESLDVKRRVGYLPENPGFYDDISAKENLLYMARLNRILVLKGLGFSLEEIRQMLDGGMNSDELRGMLRLRRAQLERHGRLDATMVRDTPTTALGANMRSFAVTYRAPE